MGLDNYKIRDIAITNNFKIQKDDWGIQYITPSKEFGWIDQDGDKYTPCFDEGVWQLFDLEHTGFEKPKKDAPIPKPESPVPAIEGPKEVKQPELNISTPIFVPEPVKREEIEVEPKKENPTNLHAADWVLIGAIHFALWAFIYFYRKF